MFIEIITEEICWKSFIAKKKENDDEYNEFHILRKNNYRAAQKQTATEINE